METADIYRRFASREARGHCPAYEELADGVAADPRLLALVGELPPVKRQPNLLLGAVRHLGGPVEDGYPAFRDWTTAHWPRVAAEMRARRTQTNEPGRCATLLPVLAGLPQPLGLIEVGASAGLCLYPDRYRYRYDGGDPIGPRDSPVVLDCRTSGPVPLPEKPPRVVWRAGIDLNPLDVTDEDDARWLRTLVWPGQTHREVRLRDAIEVARAEPPHLVRGDLVSTVDELVARVPEGATPVVLHSAVLCYLPPDDREAFAATVRRLPGHWISNEDADVLPAVRDRLPVPPPPGGADFVLALDGRPVAFTGPHGQTLDWFAEPARN